VALPSRFVDLTPIQQRTVDELIQPGRRLLAAADLPQRLRAAVQSGLPKLDGAERALRLSKDRVNDLYRCEGLFQSRLDGERPPFELSLTSAAGTLLHKAIELDVGAHDVAADEAAAPWALAERAASRLLGERRFGPFWDGLGPSARGEVLMDTVRGVELFRATFPPLAALRSTLAPVTELRIQASFGNGPVTASGSIDLVLHRPMTGFATRLLIDLKSAGAWPEYVEDMRLYALLFTMRFGVPPLRVATVFLASGEWQVEEVTDETLFHAAGRVVDAARAAARLAAGHPPELRAGPFCGWCPRKAVCPAARRGAAW
jgi:hypothetical protein